MRRVAIIGRPNVGKSSLFNRLMGQRVAIVHDQPGVTRDRLAGICKKGLVPFEIIDTGGIGDSPDPDFAEATHLAAQAAIASAELILFVVDGRAGLTPLDRELAEMLRAGGRQLILVINKVDQEMHESFASDFFELGFPKLMTVSAAHGRGTHDLLAEIGEALGGISDEALPEELSSPRLAIVGRPNVGKSSLLNRLLGEERSIVSNIAGTTRDALDVQCELGGEPYVLVDTAGLRHRSRPDTSVEIFSAMRSEEAIRRADAGLLVIDAESGVTAQDKRIAGMLQESNKACILLLNKWDLVRKEDGGRASQGEQSEVIRQNLFFLDYAPVVCISAKTGQGFSRIFTALESVRREADTRIGTGELNRFFRELFEVHPPPSKSGKRFKLLYATQVVPEVQRPFGPPEFLLFVNDEDLITDSYREYLFNRFRERWPFPGLPIRLRLKSRESRAVQDRKKAGARAALSEEALWENVPKGSAESEKPPVLRKPRKPSVRLGGKAQGAKKPPEKNARFKALKKRTGKSKTQVRASSKGKAGAKAPRR
jgi:GTP-binding protein